MASGTPTENLGLNIILGTDPMRPADINESMEIIDEKIGAIGDSTVKGLIDGKVNISDIINSLSSTVTNKPLSAAQGKALSDTIANITENYLNGNVPAGSQPSTINTFYHGITYCSSTSQGVPEAYCMVFAYTVASYHCQIANPVGTSRYYVRGANGATWSAWQKLATGFSKTLFSGEASDLTGQTIYTLSDAYTNYTHLLITCRTNTERHCQLVPTSILNSNTAVSFSHFGSESQGLHPLSEWNYTAFCRVSFPSTTTFINSGSYNNVNLTLKVAFIDGINL